MANIIPRPKLDPKSNYLLQDKLSRGWIAETQPMTFTNDTEKRKSFKGDYLNETVFAWQYVCTAELDGNVCAKHNLKPTATKRPTPAKAFRK